MDYSLKILSPVHIGCGEQYMGLNFILDGSKIYVVAPETVIALLGPQKGLKFAGWLEVNANEIAQLNSQHRAKKRENSQSDETKQLRNELRNKRQNFTLWNFMNFEKFLTNEQLRNTALYSVKAQAGVYKDTEIFPFIKQMQKPYIPGTEIKGSVRTAILYCALQDDLELQEWLRNQLKGFERRFAKEIKLVANEPNLGKQNPHNPRQKLSKLKESLEKQISEIADQLQEQVLYCRPKDAKFDVMKFLQVGDSSLLDIETGLAVSFVEPFNISIKFKLFYEYLRPGLHIPLTSFTLESDKSRNRKLKKMEFTDYHRQLMSGLDVILACCHRFAADLLTEEIDYFTTNSKIDIANHLKKIQKLNTPESPVLRIGKDEGYSSLTAGLAIKKLMPELYQNVLIHATKNKSYDSEHGGLFPKSRKIVQWDGQEVTSGWVQLIPGTLTQTDQMPKQGQTPTPAPRKPLMPPDLSALQNKFGGRRR